MLQSAELLLLLILKLGGERLSHGTSSNTACVRSLKLLNAGGKII
jgi:hypothetical protein